ncbi:CRISPR-associated protein, SAG0897 family [Fructilactobacillus florum 8D]|uniref:CRISPR-associated protein, SAG0897 family n=1 Tax=Fructilactobacillus florum 8D TaxID=1221538 RepID=W9EHD4_9LACO|nr:type II-A CRISPR-associated protein Csn2 [Fructilactobacillus florum]EKK20641.1 CRISPR-associated protein, SAG0897 family [Fructilactobacillus florum 2F]ETO40385.1 CRISPR-associated protein, SAG0897 family [Fructilactobacillus florum 8D]
MNLTVYPQAPFAVDSGKLTFLQTNNPKFYSTIVLGCKNLDKIIISENDEILELSSHLAYLGNGIDNVDLITAFKTKLEIEVIENLTESERQRLFQLDREVKSIFLGAAYLEELPLAIDDEWNLKKMAKYCGINILTSSMDNPYDIIKVIIKLYHKFYPKKLMVLNGLFNYLNSSQINDLIQMIKALDLYVLILDFSADFRKELADKCRYYRVDSDFVRFNY